MAGSSNLSLCQARYVLLLLGLSAPSWFGASGFLVEQRPSTGRQKCVSNRPHMTPMDDADSEEQQLQQHPTRRSVLLSTTTSVMTAAATTTSTPPPSLAADNEGTAPPAGLAMMQLPSGIKYLDLTTGTGPTPQYGQLCSIAYKGYIKLPVNKNDANPKPQQFDQSSAYLLKHGNGRTIAGLDEGLHTMRLGGTRRIIIPPKLGYVQSGLGPIPEYPWDRSKLNSLLDQMVALRGGTVVFEVTLLSAMDDEADQGYYQDGSLTPEQFEQLRTNIQQRAAQAAQEAAATTAAAAAAAE